MIQEVREVLLDANQKQTRLEAVFFFFAFAFSLIKPKVLLFGFKLFIRRLLKILLFFFSLYFIKFCVFLWCE